MRAYGNNKKAGETFTFRCLLVWEWLSRRFFFLNIFSSAISMLPFDLLKFSKTVQRFFDILKYIMPALLERGFAYFFGFVFLTILFCFVFKSIT